MISLMISIHALREEGDRLHRRRQRFEGHFYPRPPRGGRLQPIPRIASAWLFLSTPSARRATSNNITKTVPVVFLSTPSARRATPSQFFYAGDLVIFLSTPSARRATIEPVKGETDNDISIHALREEGDAGLDPVRRADRVISIHALREEGDQGRRRGRPGRRISIHALREEGDIAFVNAIDVINIFLSTPSARRATPGRQCRRRSQGISIHALREEGDARQRRRNRLHREISIHALREEGDTTRSRPCMRPSYFYPRPPRGGRRAFAAVLQVPIEISIHALREEGDVRRAGAAVLGMKISIHALREEGDSRPVGGVDDQIKFLSTPSARRATTTFNFRDISSFNFYPRPPRGGRPHDHHPRPPGPDISIHALREEGDVTTKPDKTAIKKISIHALREEGDHFDLLGPLRHVISIHALREEGDPGSGRRHRRDQISIHALREEGDWPPKVRSLRRSYFYPRPPRGGRPS